MIDLRTLNKEERDALKSEAARRAKAGQSSHEICRALEIRPRRYAVWAKSGRFRTSDLRPDAPSIQGGAPAVETIDQTSSAQAILTRVQIALKDGDRAKADRMVAAWASQRRRDKALSMLEAEAAREHERARREDGLSDAKLIEEVSARIGRRVTLQVEQDEKS